MGQQQQLQNQQSQQQQQPQQTPNYSSNSYGYQPHMDYPGSNYGNTNDNNQQVNSKYSHFYVFCSFIDKIFPYNHSALKIEKNSSMINQRLVENDVNTPLPVNS